MRGETDYTGAEKNEKEEDVIGRRARTRTKRRRRR